MSDRQPKRGERWKSTATDYDAEIIAYIDTNAVVGRPADTELIERLRMEIAEYEIINGKMQRLLIATANALKGEPANNVWHDWSDLPMVARRLRKKVERG